MNKLLGVVLYFFVLHKQLDAKNGNLRSSDVKNEQVEKGKKITTGWIPYYLPPKGQTIPIAPFDALPEKTTFRKSADMRKDAEEEQEGEENANSLIQSGKTNDADFQLMLQIVEGADNSTDVQVEGGFSPDDLVDTGVPTGEVDNLEQGKEALLEELAGHMAKHTNGLVAELVEEPVTAPADKETGVAGDKSGEVPEGAKPLPVHEGDEVSVEESQEGTPLVAEQAVEEIVPSQPEDVSVPNQPEDVSVPNQPEDVSVPNQPEDVSVPNQPEDVSVPNQPEDVSVPNQPEDVSVPNQPEDVSVPNQPEDVSVPNQPEDVSVPNQLEDVSVTEPDERNNSEVDTAEETSEEENFYHMEEDDEDEDEDEMGDEEFEDDYDIVMHKINDDHEQGTPSNDGSKHLTRADIVVMLAVRNMLSALNDDYGIMDFLTGFNPSVISPFYIL
ncbi:Uncharacterized protein PKNOH_S03336300 [Plasmodium knowlesi]|uniref:Uncharacterized protein n=1 Tax=Plasmodium knowlesi TaxID=5850 RepID=A0A1Y3DXY4_PLAKN|nr:Uncharacterized protein PKNOH_S03336300 [Plasmodium knowlesi]